MHNDDPLQLYPVPVAARLLGIHPRSAWTLVKEKALRSTRVRKRVMVSRGAIASYIEAQSVGGNQDAA